MPTGWVQLQDGCLLDCGHSKRMPTDFLSLNIACLLALCFSICYTCWYGISLSAVPACVVLHYRSCLLVVYLAISHACWEGASLLAMPSGVVPHCKPCLLVWCLTIGHACWRGTTLYTMPAGPFCTSTDILTSSVQRDEGWLQEVPLHQTCLLIQCHSQTCLLVQCNSIRHACWVHLFRYTCL